MLGQAAIQIIPSFFLCFIIIHYVEKELGPWGRGRFSWGLAGSANFSTLGRAPLSPSPGIHPELAGTVSDLSDLELYVPHVCVCACRVI